MAHTSPAIIEATDILPAKYDDEQMAVATFLARYSGLTLVSYRASVKDYMRFCREQHVGMLDVERGHLELYIRQMQDRGLAQSTVSHKFGVAALLLEYAEIDGRIVKNPARGVRRPPIDQDAQYRTWFEMGEIHAIMCRARLNITNLEDELAALDDVRRPKTSARLRPEIQSRLRRAIRDYSVLTVLATTGMRVGELNSLNVDSLHVERGSAYLEYIRKGGKLTQTKLPTETLLVVMRQAEMLGRKTGPLFLGDTGTRIDRRGVQRIITRLALQVGITRHVTPHGMRRTFATTANRLGAMHSDIQHALHQADPRTTDRYLRGDKGGNVSRHLTTEFLAS